MELISGKRSLARRLIHRANSEMKRPGPVTLRLNEKVLHLSEIEVFIGSKRVRKQKELFRLAKQVEHGIKCYPEYSEQQPFQQSEVESNILSKEIISELFYREVSEMLWQTDIFSRSHLKKTNEKLQQNPSIVNRAGSSAQFVHPLDLSLNSAQRLGMGVSASQLKQEVNRQEPLRVVCPWMMPGALAIFEYMKRIQGYHLEIDYEWGYSAEVRRAITKAHFEEAPDLFVLGIAPAATAVGQQSSVSYKPLMFVPSISHRVLTPKTGSYEQPSSLRYGQYYFLYEEASTPEFCFDHLERQGFVSRKTVGISHLEPDEATKALAEGNPDLKMLMFFPHYQINELLSNCQVLRFPKEEMGLQEGVLFAHESLIAETKRLRCLNVAIRNAWLELRNKPKKLTHLCDQLVQEKRFTEFLFRFTGVHHLATFSSHMS